MTNPVILLGTQSNGETLPVQVDATGRLVAEGLPGEPGLQGPPGPEGPPGPKGDDGGIVLPPDPNEGEVLGWENGELSWISLVPPTPTLVYGPSIDPGPSGTRKVINSNGGDNTGSVTDYDEWFRNQAFFESTYIGEGGVGTRGGSNTDWFCMDIMNCMGMVISIRTVFQFATATNGSKATYNLEPDSDHVIAMTTGVSDFDVRGNSPDGIVSQAGSYEFSYLVNRPELKGVKFTTNPYIRDMRYQKQWQYVQGYSIETTERWMLRRFRTFLSNVDSIQHANLWAEQTNT